MIGSSVLRRLDRTTLQYAGVLALFFVVAYGCVIDIVHTHPVMVDFPSFYGATIAARRGLDPYDVHVVGRLVYESQMNAGPVFPYLYPPFFAYTFSWLAELAPSTAQTVWTCASIIAYGIASMFAVRAAMVAAGDPKGRIPTALLAIAALLPFVLTLHYNVALGQINVFVVAFMCAAIAMSMQGRSFGAGFLLAFAVAIKLTPIFLALPWLLERRWRAFTGLAAGLITAFLVTLPFGGADAWVEFASRLPQMSHGSTIPGLFEAKSLWNFALAGFYARVFDSQGTVRAASIITILVLTAITVVLAHRSRAPDRYERLLLPLSVLMIIASPLAYTHHVIYLMPAMLLALHRALREERRVMMAVLVALAVIASTDFPPIYMQHSPPLGPIATSINLYVLLAFYGIGIWRLARRESDVTPTPASP